MRFEFDGRKNQQNLARHGIDFETAQLVFDDPYALTHKDVIHDQQEERLITLGQLVPGVILFAVHTSFALENGEEVIRLISARAATGREKKSYEEAHKRAEAPDRYHRSKERRRH